MRFQCKFRCGGRKLSWKRLWAALGVDLERRRVSVLGPPALGSKQLTPCPALPAPEVCSGASTRSPREAYALQKEATGWVSIRTQRDVLQENITAENS